MAERDKLREMYSKSVKEDYPDELTVSIGELQITLRKAYSLRYGDNPGHPAALYSEEPLLQEIRRGRKSLSKTNFEDIYRAHLLLSEFEDQACAYMKHLNPSGVSLAQTDREPLQQTISKAREADPRAAFGATVGVNRECTEEAAEELIQTYIECVAAPGFSSEAISVLAKKENIRVVEFSLPTEPRGLELHIYPEHLATLSTPSKSIIDSKEDLQVVTERQPTDDQYRDLLFSWIICRHVRSNAIVIAKDLRTVGIGTGQQDRVTSCRIAIEKAVELDHEDRLTDAVAASDGFIPFRDTIDLLAKHGVRAVVQPGGSIRDQEVISACNELGLTMALTHERAFAHF